jgi:hypothetical protein
MGDDPDLDAPERNVAPRKSAERAAREERLAKSLRDNLRRRKEQARARQPVVSQPEGPPPEPPRGGGEPPA